MFYDNNDVADHASLVTMTQTCESLQDVEKVVCLAETFKATLTSNQIASLQLEYTLDYAKKWSNLPAALSARIGLRMGTLNAVQLEAANQLLKAALGSTGKEGYDEISQLWRADDYLGVNGGGATYSSGNFYIGFFGLPSTTTKWELQMTGHHATVSNTYENGKLKGGTPSFRAAEPFAAFTYNNQTHQPLVEEYTALQKMLANFDAASLNSAKLTATFSDILLGPNKDWVFPTVKEGVACRNLSASQKENVIAAIKTYVQDVDDVSSMEIMQKYISEIDDTFIAYSGNASLTAQRDYVRIDGPSVWIEYSVQRGIVLSPNHPHSIWRDKNFDYGGTGNPMSNTSNINVKPIAFNIYPNPAVNVLAVEIDATSISNFTVSIFDQSGKVLTSTNIEKSSNDTQKVRLNVSDLPQGAYQCTVSSTNSNYLYRSSKPFVKI
jgi:hypothetical protein